MAARAARIDTISLHELRLPLREPFGVAIRTATEAAGALCIIQAGPKTGIGMCTPVEYVTGENPATVAAAFAATAPLLIGKQVAAAGELFELLAEALPHSPAARAALEMALLDIWAVDSQIPLWRHYGAQQTRLVSDITIPIIAPEQARAKAAEAWEQGFRALKIKVGDPAGVETDLSRLRETAQGAPQAQIRIDANQAFDADGAIMFLREALKAAPRCELIEQPVAKADLEALGHVRKAANAMGVPVYADESALTPESVAALLERDAVDGINVKLMKSGLGAALTIVRLAKRRGVRLMIGCMLEANLSLTAACALAAGTGAFDEIDLDSHRLLQPTDLFTGGFGFDGPVLTPSSSAPGWGVCLNTQSEYFLNAPSHRWTD